MHCLSKLARNAFLSREKDSCEQGILLFISSTILKLVRMGDPVSTPLLSISRSVRWGGCDVDDEVLQWWQGHRIPKPRRLW